MARSVAAISVLGKQACAPDVREPDDGVDLEQLDTIVAVHVCLNLALAESLASTWVALLQMPSSDFRQSRPT